MEPDCKDAETRLRVGRTSALSGIHCGSCNVSTYEMVDRRLMIGCNDCREVEYDDVPDSPIKAWNTTSKLIPDYDTDEDDDDRTFLTKEGFAE